MAFWRARRRVPKNSLSVFIGRLPAGSLLFYPILYWQCTILPESKNMGNRYRFRMTASGPSYLLSDNLEYADAAAAASAGWVDASSPVWAYTTSPAPLVGTRSFACDSTSDASVHSFTAAAGCWAFCYYNVDVFGASLFQLLNSSDTIVAGCAFRSDGSVRAINGTSTLDSAGGLVSPATTYCVWLHYTKGTGANGVTDVYVSNTSTIPGSPTISVTSGDASTDASKFRMFANSFGVVAVYDKVRVSTSAIGSNPV